MKIIQERELCRIRMMITGDSEMCELAARILQKKEPIRLSWTSILLLHILIFITTVTIGVYLATTYELGLWYIPVITVSTLQAIWSIVHLITIAEFRKQYNKYLQKIVENT